jgi:hypothetical protein
MAVMLKDRKIKYEIEVTAPENVDLETVERRIDWGILQARIIYKDGLNLTNIRLLEEGQATERKNG